MNSELLGNRSPRASWRVVLLIALAAVGGCSHSAPYVRAPAPAVTADGQPFTFRLVLVGDTGELAAGDPVLGGLEQWAGVDPERSRIVFLGDNVYPAGIRAEGHADRARSERRLQVQLEAVARSSAPATFVPGNHDWDSSGPDGYNAILRQQEMIETFSRTTGARIDMQPAAACPGPSVVDLPNVTLVFLDTEWWLQDDAGRHRPACETSTEAAIVESLEEVLAGHRDRPICVLTHHPFHTRGRHGGFLDWRDQLFPLTNLAPWAWVPAPFVYPIARRFVGNVQDLNHERYRHMVETLTAALEPHRPLILASGHDHVLQIFDGERAADYALVSGAGSKPKITKVGHDERTVFAHAHQGFMVVDFRSLEPPVLRVVEPDGAGGTHEVFRCLLAP